MKILRVALLTTLLLVGYARAQSANITFEWDQNDPADQVIEYVLYEKIGVNGEYSAVLVIPYDVAVDPPNGEIMITIGSGRHFFFVTARNYVGESEPSNIVEVQTTSPQRRNLKIRNVN